MTSKARRELIQFIFYFFRLFGFCCMHIDATENVKLKRMKFKPSVRWTILSSLILIFAVILLGRSCLVPILPVTTFQGAMLESRLVLANLSLVVSLVESISKLSSKIQFFEAMDQVDFILQKFNIPVTYKCRKYIILMTSSFLVLFIIPQIFFILNQNNRPPDYLFILIQFEVGYLLSTINSFQIVFCTFLMELRINSLNKIRNLIQSKAKLKLNSAAKDFINFYNATSNLINTFNNCFGWSIVAEILKVFACFADGWYILCTKELNFDNLFGIYTLWTHMVYVIVLCVICERIRSKKNEMHRIGLNIEDRQTTPPYNKKSINGIFALKALHPHQDINAVQFFDIDYNLLYGFYGFLINYLLISIQFELAGEKCAGNTKVIC